MFQCLLHLPFPINKPIDLPDGVTAKEVVYRFEALRCKMNNEADEDIYSFIPPSQEEEPTEVSKIFVFSV